MNYGGNKAIFLFYFTLLSVLLFPISNSFAETPRDRARNSPRHFMIDTHEEYSYPQCQQFNKEVVDANETYSVTCDDGLLSYHPIDNSFMARFEGLKKPAEALIITRYKSQLLLDLKSFVLGKLQQRALDQREVLDCFVFNMNDSQNTTQACRDRVEVLRKTTKEAYPLLRKNMAIMAGVSNEGEVDEDIEHPQESHNVAPLNSREKREVERILKDTLDKEAQDYTDRFNKQYNCPTKEQLSLSPSRRASRFCRQRILGFRARHMEKFRGKLQDQAKENYETILNEAPFLAFAEQAEIGQGPFGADAVIMSSLKTMGDHALDQYTEWQHKKPSEFLEFFKYPNVIEEFITSRSYGTGQLMCDIYEDYHEMYGPGGTEEIMQTIGIATTALVGGGLCAMTAGLGCAVAVAIGTEAMAIGSSQMDLNQALSLSRSGIVSRQDVAQAQDRRNTDLLLAPLSFVGLKAGRTIAATSAASTERSAARAGGKAARPALFDSHLKFNPTTSTDNALWIARAKSSNPGLFFDVENAALKRLNDTLGDKNLVTALTNLHKDILFKKLDALKRKYPNLDILKYSDFKSSRFSFGGEIPPNLDQELTQIFKDANEEFAQRVAARTDISIPDSETPSTWFNAGIGASADQAGLAARHARQTPRGGLQILHMDKVRDQVQTSMRSIEDQRKKVISFMPANLLEGSGQTAIPSTEVFEVLRKAKDASPEELAQMMKTRFDATLTPSQANELSQYSKDVDQFSPGIWIEERVVANLDEAVHGGFSVDFKGMGARNVSQVARDLASSGDNVDLAIKTIREGEGVVTKQFDEAKEGFQNLVSKTLDDLNIPVKTECSGDDCVSIPTAVLPDVAKEKMMAAIARTENPSGYRLSFIPPNIVAKERSVVAVHGELVEKKVRKNLTGFGDDMIPPALLDKVTFALDMPSHLGKGEVRLLVKPADGVELTAEQRRLIQENLTPAVNKVNKEIAEETGETINYSAGGVSFY